MEVTCVCVRLDGEMPDGVKVVNDSLTFLRPLQRNDSGVYRCEVGNNIGLRTRDLRIRIQGETEFRTKTAPCSACQHPVMHCIWLQSKGYHTQT